MDARLAIAFIGIGGGCARDSEEGVSSEVLRILAAHRVGDVEPGGMWRGNGEGGAWILSVQQEEGPERWILRRRLLSPKKSGERVSEVPVDLNFSGDVESGVLILDSPLDGSTRLHLCRFGREEFLLPENTVRFENASAPRPEGVVYERVGPVETLLSGGNVIEDLPAGTWEAVDSPGWGWLEVRPTGVSGSYRVRCSRRQGDEPMPVNSFARATWEANVLALDSPVFDNSTWCLRRLAEEDWLVPEVKQGHDSEQEGVRFRLAGRVTRQEGTWNGSWDGVDPPEDY